MSYVNQDALKMQKRRHSVRRVTPEEAIKAANEVVDKANDRIARAKAYGDQWQNVAAELDRENQALRQEVADLERQNQALQAEVDRLRRKVTRKSGKHRGEEWDNKE